MTHKQPFSNDWQQVVGDEFNEPYMGDLRAFLARELKETTVYPAVDNWFHAFDQTPYRAVKVVILGQDPYFNPHQAHGMSFSVEPGVAPPPSLRNIFKELHSDIGCPVPESGNLDKWARQGVLLLNAVLTVRAGQANSHRGQGWERFTDRVISEINRREKPAIFVLWGRPAQAKKALIDSGRHLVLEAPHPSPLSASRGFFGSRPFSKINAQLAEWGEEPIDFCL